MRPADCRRQPSAEHPQAAVRAPGPGPGSSGRRMDKSLSVRFSGYSSGSVRAGGVTYDHDLIIDHGRSASATRALPPVPRRLRPHPAVGRRRYPLAVSPAGDRHRRCWRAAGDEGRLRTGPRPRGRPGYLAHGPGGQGPGQDHQGHQRHRAPDMLTCQRRTAIATEVRHGWQTKSSKPRGARDLPARPHARADHRAGNVDDTNWHTQTTQLCAALTVFQHAETAAQNGGSARAYEAQGRSHSVRPVHHPVQHDRRIRAAGSPSAWCRWQRADQVFRRGGSARSG
jgi:hypothetical protein